MSRFLQELIIVVPHRMMKDRLGQTMRMAKKPRTSPRRHTIQAPPPDNPLTPPAVVSVEIAEGEAVEWIWSESPTGRRVTGYRIVVIPRHSS